MFLVATLVVAAQSRYVPRDSGQGGGTSEPPQQCKDIDAGLLFASGLLCGGPAANPNQAKFCSCIEWGLIGEADQLSPLAFERNLGQAPAGSDFVAQAAGGLRMQISSREALINLPSLSQQPRRLRARLAGNSRHVAPQAIEPLEGRVNYLLGSDPKAWVTDVPTYRRIRYPNVYPGIDLIYYGHGRNLEHDFVVSPGASPDQIEFQFDGSDRVTTQAGGDLALTLGDTELLWKKPVVYQVEECGARKPIPSAYRLRGAGKVGFEVGPYDPQRPLVIDPEVLVASYLGRLGTDIGTRNTMDASGNLYLTGGTIDNQFPISAGAFRTEPGATDRNNVMIAKFRADGGALIYTTYIGGQSTDLGLGIAVDNAGAIYATGVTLSNNFPVTANAYQRNPGNAAAEENARADCFVLKLNPAGNALVYSTYLGGQLPDGCTALAIDATGTAYLTGATSSNNFPTTEDAYQRQLRLGLIGRYSFDGFLTRLSADGSTLLFSTLFGGNGTDIPTAIALDRTGNSYIAGMTNSTAAFPISANAPQRAYKQSGLFNSTVNDAFAVKFDAAARTVLYGTYLGGGANDAAYGLSVDAQGNAYICGNTESTDFPVTPQAYQGTFGGGGRLSFLVRNAGDAFAAKLNPAGSALLYSTFLGGTREDRAFSCIAGEDGGLHLAGHTTSPDFPLSSDARQRTYGGSTAIEINTGDAFYAKLHSSGSSLVYSSYYGGSGDEAAFGLTVDNAGAAYLSGATNSPNLVTTAGAAQRGYGGGPPLSSYSPFGDAFVLKWGDPPRAQLSISGVVSAASFIGGSVAPGQWVRISGVGLGPNEAITVPQNAPPPTQLAETRVLFDGIEARLLSVSSTAILAIVPFAAGAGGSGSVELKVEYRGNTSAMLPLSVVPTAPGLYTTTGDGRGQAVLTLEDGSANSLDNPAAAGSIVTLFGTGGGVTDPPSADGTIESTDFPPLAAPVSITIADTPVEEIFFSGGVTGRIAGIFQVQFRLPANLPAGELPVMVTIGGRATQSGITIAVASSDPAPAAKRR